MPGEVSTSKSIRFGDYEVDPAAGQLRKRALKVRLPEQAFKVLAILLEHPGEVVTREVLRRRLWPEDVFVDFDNSLNSAVSRLREALNDSAEQPRFIETLPKRGYRFMASVFEPVRLTQPAAARRPKLVVLPFVNLSGDAAQEYFSDAMTDEIITELARLAPEQLAVIARTTAMRYKGGDKDVGRIGRELRVDHVVEGSARCAGDRVVLNVQLINPSDQTHLWAQRYDIELGDVFNTLGAIAQVIAAQLGIASVGDKLRTVRKPTEDLPAYNLYLRGRYHLYRATPEDMAKAKQCFEDAIARDPKFALAYDSLAEIYWYWGFLGFVPPREAFGAGIYHATHALEIDDTLAETHALLGMYCKELDYCWPDVQREMEWALELNRASPLVRTRHAISTFLPHGRMEEAAAELEGALESDPMSPFVRIWLALVLWLGRHYDRAIEQARILLELDPAGYLSHFAVGLCYREKGMFDEAIAAHHRAVELSGGSPFMLGWLGLALAQSGKTGEARAILDRLRLIAREAYVLPTSFVWIHVGLGEIDDAFTWMDRAVDGRDQMMIPIKSFPFFDPMRADPRYFALLRKMNLEP